MYENGIVVVYDALNLLADTPTWGGHDVVTLPGWAAGDPQMAVALYLHGHRSYADAVRVVDWSPIEDVPWADDDDDFEPVVESDLFPGIVDEESIEAPECKPNCACVLCHSDGVGAWTR